MLGAIRLAYYPKLAEKDIYAVIRACQFVSRLSGENVVVSAEFRGHEISVCGARPCIEAKWLLTDQRKTLKLPLCNLQQLIKG